MSGRIKPSPLNRLFQKSPQHYGRPDYIRFTFLNLLHNISKIIGMIIPGKGHKMAWRELVCKIKAFSFFQHIDIILRLDPNVHLSYAQALELLKTVDTENLLWAAEGIGYLYTEKSLDPKRTTTGFLKDNDLKRNYLGILHSGMGMSLASRFFMELKKNNLGSYYGKEIKRYLSIVGKNSIPGYTKIPVESLGFISRLLYPGYVTVIDKLFQDIDDDLVPYFWHGVGRALCFLPKYLWPGCSRPWRAIEMVKREAPHEVAHLNIISGLGWPLTLLNLSEPMIMEQVLRHHGEYLSGNDAFSNGVSSAIVFLKDCVGENTIAESFYDHKPENSDPNLVETWDQLIKTPSEKALKYYYPYLKKKQCWSEVFKYRANLLSHY